MTLFRPARDQTPRELRIGGAILLVLGLIVAACGVTIAGAIDLSASSGLHRAGQIALIASFLLFGVAAIVQGLLQLLFLRRSQTLLRLIFAICVLLAAADIVVALVMG
jgi:hypothetical protein